MTISEIKMPSEEIGRRLSRLPLVLLLTVGLLLSLLHCAGCGSDFACVYRKLKPERSGDEVRPRGRVNL
jgi:hypothetical protein